MRILKNPTISTIFIVTISFIYSFLFIFTSDHLEFSGLLSKSKTLQSSFWNGWSQFIRAGNMKYIGFVIILLTITIIVFLLLKRTKKYDEYQINILSSSVLVAGILAIIMIPIIMVLLLSDPNYAIEIIFLFAVFQWLGVLIADLVYVIKCVLA